MTTFKGTILTHIKQAAADLRKLRPGHSNLLDLYEPIFLAQEACRSRLQLSPIAPDPEVVSAKIKIGIPLIDPIEFSWDPNACGDLLEKICVITAGSSSVMAPAAANLSLALAYNASTADSLCKAILEENTKTLKQSADRMDIDLQALLVLVYNGLKPCLVQTAIQLSPFLNASGPQHTGACPICGHPPGLSTIDVGDRRFLHCRFCWHAWEVVDHFCPVCIRTLPGTWHYVSRQSEPEYRIDVCGRCGRYMKTVDLRQTARTAYLPLEQAASLYLDMIAVEKGFESMTGSRGIGDRRVGDLQ